VYSIWISLLSGGSASSGPLRFCGVFVAGEADEVGSEGSGDSTTVDIQIFLEAFLSMFLRTASFSDEFFFSGLWTTLRKCRIIRISRLSESTATRSFMQSLSLGSYVHNCNNNLLQGARITTALMLK
jgi:hypothetical protein